MRVLTCAVEGLSAGESLAALGALASLHRSHWHELVTIKDLLFLLFGILLPLLFVLFLETRHKHEPGSLCFCLSSWCPAPSPGRALSGSSQGSSEPGHERNLSSRPPGAGATVRRGHRGRYHAQTLESQGQQMERRQIVRDADTPASGVDTSGNRQDCKSGLTS